MQFTDSTYLDFAIQTLCPGAEYTFNDADYSTINWIKLDGKAPTQAEINAEIARFKAAEIALEADRAAKKSALLDKLGITEAEARLLLG